MSRYSKTQWRPVRVLGLDGAYVLGWGEKRPVLVAVGLGEGQPIVLGMWMNMIPRPYNFGWSRWYKDRALP